MTYRLILDPGYITNEGEIIDSFLVNSDGVILEYARIQTEYGINTSLVASTSLNYSSTEQLRDFVITPDRTLHLYAGTFEPTLQSYNWQSSDIENTQTYAGWSTANNISYGGIDYYQNYVFVTDMKTYGSNEDVAKGIIRFSQTEESATRFAEEGNFIDLTVGLDNLIYGLESYGKISVYDPESLELVRSFTLQDKYNDYRGIAVNAEGEIFSAAWSGDIYYFDPQGSILDVNRANTSGIIDLNTNNFNDINISPDGTELIASDRNGLIALLSINDRFLELQDVFPTGGNSAFVSFGTGSKIFNPNDNSVPTISISDAETLEWGEFEPARLDFTVSLSQATNETIEVDVYSFIPWRLAEYDRQPQIGVDNFSFMSEQEYNSLPQNVDYNDVAMKSQILTFAPGETEKTFSLDVFDDWEPENNEQVYVKAVVVSGNATIEDGLAIGRIIDDDFVPTVSISDAEMVEGDYEDFYNAPPTMKFTVSLDAAAYYTVSVDLSTVDYPLTTIDRSASIYEDFYPLYDWTNLTFEPGETTKTIEVEVHPDEIYEPDEQFAVEVVSAYGAVVGDGLAIGTIIDDDFMPTVSISDAEVLEKDEFESTWIDFTVSLSAAFDETVEVEVYSFVPGENEYDSQAQVADYNDVAMTGQILTFTPGETEKIFSVEVLGDLELEADEQLYAEIAYISENATIGDRTGVGTILDNEARKPQVSISDAIAIEGMPLEFTVELDRATEDYVTVDAWVNPYDNYMESTTTPPATEGEDYWGSWHLTFAPGETSKTFQVETNYDWKVEGDEQFAVEISADPAQVIVDDYMGIGTIADNDLIIGEVGHVKGINHFEQHIQFQNQYQNPVVFVSPLTRKGRDPAIARITDIQAGGFNVLVQEPTLIRQQAHNGYHVLEDFSYMVMEAGSWTMPDGSVLEVGTTEVDAITRSASWDRLQLNSNFDNPTVISSIQTYNNEDFIRLRQRDGNTATVDLALEKEEALLKTDYATETVGYIAVESGEDYLMGEGTRYVAGDAGRNFDHRWQQLDLENHPYLFASTNSYYGGDSVGLRSQMGSIMLEEDTSRDREIGHTKENIAYLSFDRLGTITTEVWSSDFI